MPPQNQPTRPSLGDWPRLTRFYGLRPDELATIPGNILQVYVEQLPVLESEEMLGAILASDMPHAREKDRKDIFRALRRGAEAEEEAVKIDPESQAGRYMAASMGIGIQIERPEPPAEAPADDDAVESSEEILTDA